MRIAFDTNVMAYAEGLERVPADTPKCAAARRLLRSSASETLILARQALAELHFVLVRWLNCTPAEASSRVRDWVDRAQLVDTNPAVFDAALELASDHKLRIFDALILAAAADARCDLLLSEDLQDGFAWRGVVVSNPFGDAPERRVARLLAGAAP